MFLVFDSVDAEVSLWISGQLVYAVILIRAYDSWSESFWVRRPHPQDGQ